ncbi:aminopeptidase, partial [Mammaliicoccus sciuri]|uniref:aminopeptidase n=1 Tax=Mammaliicoccus sciuri TaxID=1296 RepID=UPI00289729DE
MNVQKGQEVVVSAFTESAHLVRLVAKHAYERGAKNVHIRWSDGVLTRLKYEHAPQDVFEQFPEWEAQMMETIAKRGGAFITILSE